MVIWVEARTLISFRDSAVPIQRCIQRWRINFTKSSLFGVKSLGPPWLCSRPVWTGSAIFIRIPAPNSRTLGRSIARPHWHIGAPHLRGRWAVRTCTCAPLHIILSVARGRAGARRIFSQGAGGVGVPARSSINFAPKLRRMQRGLARTRCSCAVEREKCCCR